MSGTMDIDQLSTFEKIPSEIRIMIYELLLNDNSIKTIEIRNQEPQQYSQRESVCRTSYHIVEHNLYRRSLSTSYCTTSGIDMHTSIMRVNRKIYHETAHMLYSNHAFSFDRDLEAVVPFFSDMRPETRLLITEISLTKKGFVYSRDYDRCEWTSVCEYLAKQMYLRSLKLCIEGGKPRGGWGNQIFSATDFTVLKKARYEPLEWVWEILGMQGLQNLQISSEIRDAPLGHSQAMTFFAEFSASIETGFAEFLRQELIR